MSQNILINAIGEWLIDQALQRPEIVDLFSQVCKRLTAAGVPVSRARLTWPTLHPLFRAETILWRRGEVIEFEQFRHQEELSDQWNASPMNYVLENNLDTFRRNLDGPNKVIDFEILEELVEQGHTDYFLIATSFDETDVLYNGLRSGILVMWSSDRPGGFSNGDLEALMKIQRRFAAACKSVVQNRIAENIARTYLGNHAGKQVLEGAIKLGDGHETEAVVWYTDMRRSTELADTMPPEDFIQLLNNYFEATAGSAIEFGGEVLDFVGDAVLAVFPFDDEKGKAQAIRCATLALEKAQEVADAVNTERVSQGMVPFEFGVGINIGKVMFGNIGVSTRLSFSVIGPTVNEVERIETLTKAVDSVALVTKEIADVEPDAWTSMGHFGLKGVSQKTELFGLLPPSKNIVSTVDTANSKSAQLTQT